MGYEVRVSRFVWWFESDDGIVVMNVDRSKGISEMRVYINLICKFPTWEMVINGLCEKCVWSSDNMKYGIGEGWDENLMCYY